MIQTKKEFFAQLSFFDQLLCNKTFLIGENLSIADIDVALNLLPVSFVLYRIEIDNSIKFYTFFHSLVFAGISTRFGRGSARQNWECESLVPNSDWAAGGEGGGRSIQFHPETFEP